MSTDLSSLASFAKAAVAENLPSDAATAIFFLKQAYPEFVVKYEADEDRMVKVGRAIRDLVKCDASDDAKLDASLVLLVQNCEMLVEGLDCPKVRFGKTGINISRVTCGGMRLQQAWGPSITSMDQVTPECQANVVAILRQAINHGINHIETARGYGCSELQLGVALEELFAEGFVKREDLIIQTKVNPFDTAEEFRKVLETSFELLKLEYVDLFSFHGMNLDSHYDLLFNNGENGNLYDVVEEYVKAGRIRHVGFSTHGVPRVIKKFIVSDKFEYVNLHYHFFGSYTASGSGPHGGNIENVRLCHERDMGVFIISPYDKGGRLYAPSRKLRDLCLPDLEPITFGSQWLWTHEEHDAARAPIHTIVCGSGRPSDMDEPVIAAMLLEHEETRKKITKVSERLNEAMVDAVGKKWMNTWYEGLPDCYETKDATNISGIVWCYNLIKAYGLVDFARERYSWLEGNKSKWDPSLSYWDNVDKIGRIGWGYVPGTSIDMKVDYTGELSKCPTENVLAISEALAFVHSKCAEAFKNKPRDPGCETAYDMRPWTAFPERPNPSS